MGQIKAFVITIIGLSIFLGIIHMVIPRKTMSSVLKLIAGLIMLITLVSPFTKAFNIFSPSGFNIPTISNSQSLKEYENNYKNQVLQIACLSIKDDINEYFLSNYNKKPSNIDVVLCQDEKGQYIINTLLIYLDLSFENINEIKKEINSLYKPEVLEIRRS